MTLLFELQGLMFEHRFRPNHAMGQNFIISESLLNRMIEVAELKKTDIVLEIGCGTGFLTRKLLEHCKVVGFEKDEKMVEILKKNFGENKNFTLIEEDFLSSKPPKFNKIVSLPPYGISTDLAISVFHHAPQKAVLVLQKEFVEKLTAEPGFWDYNYVSVLTSLRYTPSTPIRNLQPRCFYPSPDSFSSLVVLDAKKKQPKIKNEDDFVYFLKTVFRYKNKNLSNAIRNAVPDIAKRMKIHKEKALETVLTSGLAEDKVSVIEPEIFAEIFTRISQ
ncbi:MAG TPA: 16S rRNA (adenine(1518)-N(6)/adenine(1519)-N(6))-dimethyltransferase RsmA [archaeon]|nr:16S rRNA (adenine(1518)-N(6)/adenine(1519)-N(6))-dimethyltransferase RsmA [archaeon]